MKVSSWFMMTVGMTVAPLAMGSPFLGPKQCATCHPKAYQQWQASAHAHAARHLTSAERRDPRCSRCHAPNARDGLRGVHCEVCHGPGRAYWPAEIMKDVKKARVLGLKTGSEEAMCRQCHQSPTTRGEPFNYLKALELVRHVMMHSTSGNTP